MSKKWHNEKNANERENRHPKKAAARPCVRFNEHSPSRASRSKTHRLRYRLKVKITITTKQGEDLETADRWKSSKPKKHYRSVAKKNSKIRSEAKFRRGSSSGPLDPLPTTCTRVEG
ncbi:unnamed protein product, partial [Nesidiocoris tenuis]